MTHRLEDAELLPVVDSEDHVVGSARRDEVHDVVEQRARNQLE